MCCCCPTEKFDIYRGKSAFLGRSHLMLIRVLQVLDFGASRDGVPDYKRGKRIVVNTDGIEVSDPHDASVDMDLVADE